MKDADARALLRDLFDAALAAARPATCLAPYIARLQPPKGKTIVIGAGKASAAMARAVEDQWPHPLEGLVVTRYGHGEACKKIEIVEAAHPVPDEKGRAAAGRILEKVKGLTADDLVLCLISGGASALLALPAPGLTLTDKQDVNRALLKSGANIVEMNTVRKHLSAIKGGRLAIAAQPARVLSWLISDVPNDDPGVIGSGPTVPDRTTFADALAVLAKYRLSPPAAVFAHLEKGAAGAIEEKHLTASAKAQEDESHRKLFLLQVVQPGLAGLMDGSVSTLAPIFAAAFASHKSWEAFLVGLAASIGAGISMAFSEGLSDDGSLTGRGSPWLRGGVTGLMTTAGGIGHTLPFLISDFRVAMLVATIVVAVELGVISYIRHRYMDTPFLQAAFQVIVGGVLVFLTGWLIGSA